MNTVKLGVLGTRRGLAFAEAAAVLPDVEIAALCGRDAERVRTMADRFGIAGRYARYDDLLTHPGLDGVIVANYADAHVEPVCRALRAGKAVLSEVPACVTVAEAVALIETVERSGRPYMFGENFCYLAFVQHMRRLYQRGELGEITYAEGEYVHFTRDVAHLLIDPDLPHHWRTWIQPTFYCTHSVGPLLYITGQRPVSVLAATGQRRAGEAVLQQPALELVRLANGALVKSLHGSYGAREPWQPWYLVAGDKGCVENSRWPDPNEITLYLDRERQARRTTAGWPEGRRPAPGIQHWGADQFLLEAFGNSVRRGEPPDLDVFLGVNASLVGNFAWRSILGGGGWQEIPDLRDPAARDRWRTDRWSCRPDAPNAWRWPNNAVTGRTQTLTAERRAALRQAQEHTPYCTSVYRD